MAFNDSIGAYGIAVESLSESQSTLSGIKKDLDNVDDFTAHRTTILTELTAKQRQYGETIETLEKIAHIRQNADKIDESIAARDYDTAESLIVDSSATAAKYGIFQLPILSSDQLHLQSQRQTLCDSLVESINGVIYLKSASTSSSLANSSDASALFRIASSDIEDVSRELCLPLNDFLSELSGGMKDGVSPGADTQSFHALSDQLKLLSKLEKLPEALLSLSDHCGLEMRRLVRRTAEEVKANYPDHMEFGTLSHPNTTSSVPVSSDDLLGGFRLGPFQGINTSVVADFFSSLFRRSIGVLQHHLAIRAISASLSYTYDFSSAWKQMQNQLGSVIYSYLVDEKLLETADRQQNYGMDDSSPFAKPLKELNPDDSAPIVQFARFCLSDDSTVEASHELLPVLQQLFPGQFAGTLSAHSGTLFIEDDGDGISHVKKTVLVQPNIFNMASIVDGFLLFVGSASLVFPKDQKNVPINFFKHFMDYIFRTQLESTLYFQFERMCAQNRTDAASMQQFFSSVLGVMDTSLYYREPYAEIVLKLLDKLVAQYQSQINEVVPPEFLRKVRTRLVASWVEDPDLMAVSSKLVSAETSPEDKIILGRRELQLSLKNGNNTLNLIKEHDFLDPNRFLALSEVLYRLLETLKWLPQYKRTVKPICNDPESLNALKETWHISDSDVSGIQFGGKSPNSTSHPYLALHGKLLERFDNIVTSLQKMAMKTKLYIRYDLRVKAIWCVCSMLSRESWMPEYETEEIDVDVIRFNRNVMETNRLLEQKLSDADRTEIFVNLPDLLDYLLVSESRRIIKINSNGVYRMFVNVRVLQQMLRNVLDPKDVNFGRSLSYFELFKSTEKGILDSIKRSKEKRQFSLEDYKNMVRLVFSESMDRDMQRKRTSSYSAGKRFSDTLKKLESEWQ
ncbi:DEKNAAC100414 [Brettanomyces naardenensis]|uniref:Exocyst complex component Sec8 n=1 Tax=Brettanomyces naardenensis TaxID=13370 RepID=A0A448YEJ1_BRENA|nr:DEKNAAC100414 [Brettanomyces naardenensis]